MSVREGLPRRRHASPAGGDERPGQGCVQGAHGSTGRQELGLQEAEGRKGPESGDPSLRVGSGAVACPTVRGARGGLAA